MSIIRPELKRLHSPDIYDLENPTIDQSEPFCVLVQAMFGPDNSEGEESFDILVCNSQWVEQKSGEKPFNSRHHLIMSHFNIDDIREFLINSTKEYSGSTWDEVATKLARIGKWEFEDYVN